MFEVTKNLGDTQEKWIFSSNLIDFIYFIWQLVLIKADLLIIPCSYLWYRFGNPSEWSRGGIGKTSMKYELELIS